MGKSKKPRIPNYHHVDRPKSQTSTTGGGGGTRKMSSFSRVSTSKGKGGKGKGKGGNVGGGPGAGGKLPTIPFQRGDRVLLVGEGDFSFALSLATHHGCRNLLATSYDSEETLYQKYPQAKGHIEQLRGMGSATTIPSSSTGLKRKRHESFDSDDDEEEEQERKHDKAQNSKEEPENPSADKSSPPKSKPTTTTSPKALFSIDARKLGTPTGGAKAVRNGFPRPTIPSSNRRRDSHPHAHAHQKDTQQTQKQLPAAGGGPWDIICFNFPHVGGLSTDVNRQVRANQELLVEFFKASVPLLSNPVHTTDDDEGDEDEEDYENEFYPSDPESNTDTDSNTNTNTQKENPKQKPRTSPGQILISLFEGEPYTLWNIRDLARHAGLRVVTSFRFPWHSYPGYAHARTLGEIEGRNGGRGGWRGEEREARMFVFERKDVGGGVGGVGGEGTGRKRKRRVSKGKGRGKGKGKDEGWGDSDSD
ncbi:hypothetical protein FQN52_003047 [Onygenales sp. PD_12]|nr:hypothetical protein FQN52_003047 [Onygenales sp. PD_12]